MDNVASISLNDFITYGENAKVKASISDMELTIIFDLGREIGNITDATADKNGILNFEADGIPYFYDIDPSIFESDAYDILFVQAQNKIIDPLFNEIEGPSCEVELL